MILALSGKLKSGKSTVANIIEYLCAKKLAIEQGIPENEIYPFEGYDKVTRSTYSGWKQVAFAAKLKQIVALLIGCNVQDLEDQEFKELTMTDLYNKGLITKEYYESLEN